MPDRWKGTNQILISYRREDTAAITGRIYDRLVRQFGREAIFRDIDSTPLGINFRKHLDETISKCAVVLVVIGAKWLGHNSESGKSRLDDPRDFVRIEIESALKRDIPIIPLLVDNAALPEPECLPESLRELCDRNGLEFGRDRHFDADISRLLGNLDIIMATVDKMTQTFQNAAFDTLWVSKPQPAPSDTANPSKVKITAETNQPKADALLIEPQPETPSQEVEKIEPEVARNRYIVALLLGMILPSVFALAGGFAGRRLLSSPLLVISEMSGVLLAEMAAVYALAGTGFLIGWKSRQASWKVELLTSAFPIAINLGGAIQLLFRGSDNVASSFFIMMAFCITPLMPLFAYVGLHLGMLYSSRKAKARNPIQPSHEPE